LGYAKRIMPSPSKKKRKKENMVGLTSKLICFVRTNPKQNITRILRVDGPDPK